MTNSRTMTRPWLPEEEAELLSLSSAQAPQLRRPANGYTARAKRSTLAYSAFENSRVERVERAGSPLRSC
jgi:hypothetical protein